VDSLFIYLVVAELAVILLIVVIKLLFNYLENKKIKSILDFIDKRAEANIDGRAERFKECIDILKQSSK